MQGRRLPDELYCRIPDDAQPGDFWRYVDEDGVPKVAKGDLEAARAVGNLTGGVWGCMDPLGGLGTLVLHTVREHDDGMITVAPNDGSSNSILIDRGNGQVWHGYIDHGVWRSV